MQRLRPSLLVACALVTISFSGLATAFFNDLLSLRFSVLGRDASGEIAIVAIDAPSLAAEGVWPWPRSLHARLIDRLLEAGAREIVFDVDFSSASTSENDQAFEDALRRASGSVALPTFKQSAVAGGREEIFVSQPLQRFIGHAWPAAVNVRSDPDGIVRRYMIGQMLAAGVAPSPAAFLAERGSIEESSFLIDFAIRRTTIPIVSFVDVLKRDETLVSLKGKRVVIGATAVELGDHVTVPGGRVIAGVMLQALAGESLLQGRDLQVSPPWLAYGVSAVFALLIAIVFGRIPARSIAILLFGIPFTAEFGAYVVQATMPVVFDTAPLHFAAFAWAVIVAFEELNLRDLMRRMAERRFHRVAMSIADGLICTDETGRIVFWNSAAERMFGRTAHDMLGQSLSPMIATLKGEPWRMTQAAVSPGAGLSQELQGRRQDGSTFLIEATFSTWETSAGLNHSVALRDISMRKREEERIRYLAEHDTLTGLLNRRSFIQILEARVVAALDNGTEVALLLIDLDRFKEINDTLGHAAGDDIIRLAAIEIQNAAGVENIVARLGGDEFAVILSAPSVRLIAEQRSDAIVECFRRRDFAICGFHQHLTASVGIAIYPLDSDCAEGLISDADLTLYKTKEYGGGGRKFFDKSFRDEFENRITLAEELKLALARGEFVLHYQPQISLQSGHIVGAEALIRWQHPERGLVPPNEFIPLLNTLPISNDVSLWTLRTACRQAREWQREGNNIRMAVNLAPAQFRTMDLPAMTALVLEETRLPPDLLELEVTEDVVIEDDRAARETFSRLRALGVHLAWDDFGTGYGSLIYLKKFPLNRLKIDQTFVRNLEEGSADFAIVDYTIKLAKQLGLSITAEGIENPAVAELLTRIGCDEGQGYLFGRPVAHSQFQLSNPKGSTPLLVA